MSPRYPIYIPSKGRATSPFTIAMFLRDRVEFRVVVEEAEASAYAAVCGAERVLVLPESGRGLTYSRNWIKAHAAAAGYKRHWQFDDDIRGMNRPYKNQKLSVAADVAIMCAEDFTDRYTNVALTSFNSQFFYAREREGRGPSRAVRGEYALLYGVPRLARAARLSRAFQ